MKDALRILDGVEGVNIISLGSKDIVRNEMVTRIVNAYDKDAKLKEEQNRVKEDSSGDNND